MIRLVHWKDIVGKDFLERFTSISKDLYFAKKRDQSGASYATELKKISEDDIEKFRKARSFMRHCGYEIKGKNYYDRGWFGFPIVESGNISFRYMADDPTDGVEFISLSSFLSLKHNLEQDYVENEYYKNVKPAKLIENIKPRADIDEDFPDEKTKEVSA
jgi:hypothetical protein